MPPKGLQSRLKFYLMFAECLHLNNCFIYPLNDGYVLYSFDYFYLFIYISERYSTVALCFE